MRRAWRKKPRRQSGRAKRRAEEGSWPQPGRDAVPARPVFGQSRPTKHPSCWRRPASTAARRSYQAPAPFFTPERNSANTLTTAPITAGFRPRNRRQLTILLCSSRISPEIGCNCHRRPSAREQNTINGPLSLYSQKCGNVSAVHHCVKRPHQRAAPADKGTATSHSASSSRKSDCSQTSSGMPSAAISSELFSTLKN